VFKYLPAQTPESQFAVSISKKAMNKAVDRNKSRRQIYVGLRGYLNEISDPIVCLVFFKKSAPKKVSFSNFDAQIQNFINHLKPHA